MREEKGRRRSARKAQRVAPSKPETHPSVPPFCDVIQAMTLERQKLVFALRGALQFYDRVSGNLSSDSGWTAKDMRYLDEIRALAWRGTLEGDI
jgi:hypothetical protein